MTHYFVRLCFSFYVQTQPHSGCIMEYNSWKKVEETGSKPEKSVGEQTTERLRGQDVRDKIELQSQCSEYGTGNLQAQHRSDPQSNVHGKMVWLTINILHAWFSKFHILRHKETPQSQIGICNDVICVFSNPTTLTQVKLKMVAQYCLLTRMINSKGNIYFSGCQDYWITKLLFSL